MTYDEAVRAGQDALAVNRQRAQPCPVCGDSVVPYDREGECFKCYRCAPTGATFYRPRKP